MKIQVVTLCTYLISCETISCRRLTLEAQGIDTLISIDIKHNSYKANLGDNFDLRNRKVELKHSAQVLSKPDKN